MGLCVVGVLGVLFSVVCVFFCFFWCVSVSACVCMWCLCVRVVLCACVGMGGMCVYDCLLFAMHSAHHGVYVYACMLWCGVCVRTWCMCMVYVVYEVYVCCLCVCVVSMCMCLYVYVWFSVVPMCMCVLSM